VLEDAGERRRICRGEVALGAGGQADSEAESLLRRALLVDLDDRLREAELEEASGIQTAGATPEYGDGSQFHGHSSCRADRTAAILGTFRHMRQSFDILVGTG